MTVAIRGGGIAATICAHLLTQDGIATTAIGGDRAPMPMIMLSDPALRLLRDLLGQPALFAGKPRISQRIVAWGGRDPAALPHGAIIVSGAEIAAALPSSPRRATAAANDAGDTGCTFTIHSAPPFPAGSMQRFGARSASTTRVQLRDEQDQDRCWIEAVEDGWLFLIPAAGDAWLLGVGAPIERLIGQSRHVARRVDATDATEARFETCPRLLDALHGEDWLACGSAAIAFDPICGDGTAQAVREAILAAAVIGAIRDGGDAEALRGHYQAMLIAAMRRHLKLCGDYYATGGSGAWWTTQHAALVHGHDWCTAQLAITPEPRFELRDLRLVPRERAA